MTDRDDDWAGLLRRGLAGDGRAYAQFLAVIAPVIRGIVRARGRTLDASACEDVVQDVLLAIHLKRQTWRTDAPVRPWVYAIARHKVIDAFRARGTRVEINVDEFADVLPAEPGEDPLRARDMDRMIGMLDDRSARLVRMIGVEGHSAQEAGTALGLSEGAVRVALHRAFARLASLRERHLE